MQLRSDTFIRRGENYTPCPDRNKRRIGEREAVKLVSRWIWISAEPVIQCIAANSRTSCCAKCQAGQQGPGLPTQPAPFRVALWLQAMGSPEHGLEPEKTDFQTHRPEGNLRLTAEQLKPRFARIITNLLTDVMVLAPNTRQREHHLPFPEFSSLNRQAINNAQCPYNGPACWPTGIDHRD